MRGVLIECGFLQGTIVILLGRFVNGKPVIRRVGLKDVGEVGWLRPQWDAQTVWPEPRETSLWVNPRLSNIDSVIFLDRSLNGSPEPLTVCVHIRTIELVVGLESHVGEDGRLSSAQIAESGTAVEGLAVVLVLENKVVDHTFGHIYLAIDQESQGDEVGVPVVRL